MKTFIARVLRHLGFLRFDLIVVKVSHYPEPDSISLGEIHLVESHGIRKWACLKCPGGCNVLISLSLAPERRPRWTIASDFWGRPTISPSVHQQRQCRCHFWVKAGIVEWCEQPKHPTT